MAEAVSVFDFSAADGGGKDATPDGFRTRVDVRRAEKLRRTIKIAVRSEVQEKRDCRVGLLDTRRRHEAAGDRPRHDASDRGDGRFFPTGRRTARQDRRKRQEGEPEAAPFHFSSRARSEDVSQRLPPIAWTSP